MAPNNYSQQLEEAFSQLSARLREEAQQAREADRAVLEQALAEERQRYQTENAEPRAMVQAAPPAQPAPQPAPQPVPQPPPATTAIKVRDFPAFSGQRDELPLWIAQVRNAIRSAPTSYPSEESKLCLAFSRLEGTAAKQVLPYFSNSSLAFSSLEQLFHTLESAFGDPDRKATAQAKLRGLRQKNREFAQFLSDFQRLAADCCYDEEALKSSLQMGVCDELKFALALVPEEEVSTLPRLIHRCLTLDN